MSLVGPFPVTAAIQRLRTLPELRLVGGAGGLQVAQLKPPRALPAAFVLVRERGRAPADYTGAYAQPIDVTLNVVLWVSHAGDEIGEKAAAAMTEVERAVRTALRDWSPSAPFEPLYLSDSGNDIHLGAHLTRQVIFQTQYRDQEMP